MLLGNDERNATARTRQAVGLGAAVLVSVGGVVILTMRSGFVLDDIINLRVAQVEGLSLDYLLMKTSGHFAPGHLFFDWLVQSIFGFEFAGTQLILAAGFALSLVLFHQVVVMLTDRPLIALVATLMWGVSVANTQTMQWWAAGIDRVPANVATLAAILGYLWYRRTERVAWLYASVGATVIGLLFYVKVAFVPGYIILLRVLVLDPDEALRTKIAAVWREWRTWVPHLTAAVVLGSIYAAYYPDYGSDRSLGVMTEHVATLWSRVVVPNLVGLYVPQGPLQISGWATILVAQLGVAAFVAWTALRRSGGWQPWAFFALAAVPNVVPVTLNRLDYYPPQAIAYVNAFNQELYWLFFMAAAVALARRMAPHPEARHPATAPIAAFLVGSYVIASWVVGWHLNRPEVWLGAEARPYFERLEISLGEAASVEGAALVDSTIDPRFLIPLATPYNSLSEVAPLLHDRPNLDAKVETLFEITPEGTLRSVRFTPVLGGPVLDLISEGVVGIAGGEAETVDGQLCVAGRAEAATVGLVLGQTLAGPSHLRINYEGEPGSTMALITEPIPMVKAPLFDYARQRVVPIRRPADQTRVLALDADAVDKLFIIIQPGSKVCIGSLEIGLLVDR